jgi:hypothetical protein
MANNTLSLSGLDVSTNQQNLRTFLQNYPQFKDYNFEGSNLTTLIDLLAYNTYLLSFYGNMILNESFADTAQLRESIISHAKKVNYMPRSARSSQGLIDIQIYPTDTPTYINIAAGTKFQGSNGNNIFTFATNNAVTVATSNGVYVVNAVPIYEGITVTETFTVDNTVSDQKFVLSNPNIDTTSLSVNVPNANGAYSTWNFFSSLLNVTASTNAYFMQASGDNYEILFGNNIVGAYPPNGGVIQANYRVCNLDTPNGITVFKATSSVGGYAAFTVSASKDVNANLISAAGGGAPESNSSIQFNAPRSYQTLDRAIVPDDYKNIIFENFPEVRDVYVYGGEDVSPPQYGKTFIAIDLTNAVGLSQLEINLIQNFMSQKTMIVKPIVVAPDYLYVAVNSTIQYNQNVSPLSETDIESLALSEILGYNDTSLNLFNTTFRYTKLGAAIDNTDTSITSQETDVKMFKKLAPTTGTKFTAVLNYQNSIIPSTVSSTSIGYNGIQCVLQDDGKGALYITTTSGTTIINMALVGSVDYTNGIINITNLNITDYVGDSVNLSCNSVEHDITVTQNSVVVIDQNSIDITAVGVRK